MPHSIRVEICREAPERLEDRLAGWRTIESHDTQHGDASPAAHADGGADGDDAVPVEWAYPPDYCVVAWSGDDPVGYLGVFERDGRIDGRPVRLGGLAGLATDPAFRHRGIATAALRAAVRELSRPDGPEVALLFAHENHVPWFEHLGWKSATKPPLFRQPSGMTVVADAPTLVMPLRGGPAPAGAIDLCGLPW